MNGPDVLKRVLEKVCEVEQSQINDECDNFGILPRERKCFAVSGKCLSGKEREKDERKLKLHQHSS